VERSVEVIELSILLITVTEVEVVIVVVIIVMTVTEVEVVMIVVPSCFYRTVDPSSLVIKRPSSVYSALIATIFYIASTIPEVSPITAAAASAPSYGILASKSSSIF